ncbi:hypothetical protein [Streptomyces kaempferi]|uniref:Uncharacterized protein n=1 Tax=Streptomyces kaempferi TaxID=333725 RepID=A0ABW3XVI7_9ACTN
MHHLVAAHANGTARSRLRDDDSEDRFIDDVIVAGIGEGTNGWESSGSSYSGRAQVTHLLVRQAPGPKGGR